MTIKLTKLGIPYKWEFPFKLLVEYQRKIKAIRTVQQARDFEVEHDKGEFEVEVLNEIAQEGTIQEI